MSVNQYPKINLMGEEYYIEEIYNYGDNKGVARLINLNNGKKQTPLVALSDDGTFKRFIKKEGEYWGLYAKSDNKEATEIAIAEGEKCVNHLAYGLSSVDKMPIISPVGGEWDEKYIKHYLTDYENLEVIYYFPDNDEIGKEKQDRVRRVAHELGIEVRSCEVWKYLDTPPDEAAQGYDVADYVQNYIDEGLEKIGNRLLGIMALSSFLERISKYENSSIPNLEVLFIASTIKILENNCTKELKKEIILCLSRLSQEHFAEFQEPFAILESNISELVGISDYFLSLGNKKFQVIIKGVLNSPYIATTIGELNDLAANLLKKAMTRTTLQQWEEYSRSGGDASELILKGLSNLGGARKIDLVQQLADRCLELAKSGADFKSELMLRKQIRSALGISAQEAKEFYDDAAQLCEASGDVRTMSEILDDTECPDRYTFKNFLLTGCVTLLIGDAGCGKTRLLYDMCRAYLTNEVYCGKYPKRCSKDSKVLIVNSDMPYQDFRDYGKQYFKFVHNRILSLGRNTQGSGQWKYNKKADKKKLEQILDNENIGILVVDSFSSIHHDDFDEYKPSARAAIDYFQDIGSKYGCAIVVIHHPNKNGSGVNRARGSTSIPGAASAVWELIVDGQYSSESCKYVDLVIHKSRGDCSGFKFRISKTAGIGLTSGDSFNILDCYLKLTAEYLRKNPNSPFTYYSMQEYVHSQALLKAPAGVLKKQIPNEELFTEAVNTLEWQGNVKYVENNSIQWVV